MLTQRIRNDRIISWYCNLLLGWIDYGYLIPERLGDDRSITQPRRSQDGAFVEFNIQNLVLTENNTPISNGVQLVGVIFQSDYER